MTYRRMNKIRMKVEVEKMRRRETVNLTDPILMTFRILSGIKDRRSPKTFKPLEQVFLSRGKIQRVL